MRVFDPINVAMAYCAIIIGMRALFYALIQLSDLLYYHLPKLPTIRTVFMAVISFWILAHALLVVPFVFLCTINPVIRNFFPVFACSDELAMRLEERVSRCVTIAFVPFLNSGGQAFVVFASFLYRTTAQLASSLMEKMVTMCTTEAVTSEPSLELVPSLTVEEREAEARRCRLPGPVCDAARSQLEIKRQEVNELVRQLGEAEQRELDASGAVTAEQETRRRLEQRLARTEQQLTRYGPQADAVRTLELQLAESEARIGEANARTETAERHLRTEVEHTKWTVERKEAHARKLHEDLRNVVQTAREKIGALRAEVGSLQRQLDSAKRETTPVDVQARMAEKDETIQTLIAEKDETIQTLTEAGLAIEKDRNDKMEYAERMYALLIAENESLRRQLRDSTNDKQANERDADITSLRVALAESQEKVLKIEAAISEKQTKLEELSTLLRNNAAASDAEITSVRVALAESQQHVQRIEAALFEKQTKLEESETQLKNAVSFSDNNISDAKSQVDTLRAEFEAQITIERAAHVNEMNQASTINNQQQESIASLRRDLEVSSNEKITLHQEISRLQDLVQQHVTSNAMNEGIEQQLAAVRNQHQADMNQANAVLASKEETIKQLQGRLEDSQEEIAGLTDKVAEMDGGVGDEAFDELEEKLRKALTNEKNNLERIAEMEEELERARVDEEKYIQEISEMKKKRQEDASKEMESSMKLRQKLKELGEQRDILAPGKDEFEKLRSALGRSTYETAERDIRIGELEEKVASLEEQLASLQSESESEDGQSQPEANYTDEELHKHMIALGLIEDDDQEGPADEEGGSKKENPSNDDTEMEGAQPFAAAKSTGSSADITNSASKGDDDCFEAAMNEAIDESNREYTARTAATFTPDVQVLGVNNPFASPGPSNAAPQLSTFNFGGQSYFSAFGKEGGNPLRSGIVDPHTFRGVVQVQTVDLAEEISRAAPEQLLDVDAARRDVLLADARVDAPRQQLAQLGPHGAHLGLCHVLVLLLLLLALAAAPGPAAGLVELLAVVLDAELLGGGLDPVLVLGALLLGQRRVRELLGQVHARLEAGRDAAVNVDGPHKVLLLARLSGVHLGRQPARRHHLFGPAEDDAQTGALGTRRAAGAVDVHVGGAGHVVVDDLVDAGDVETAGRNVGGDEDGGGVGLRRGELFDGAETGLLRHLRVQRRGVDVEVLEEGRQAADGADGVCEDERSAVGVEQDDGVQVQILERV
ncbi:hypothetical protein CTA2_7969 [Colletotrichum tanaceti]|uniref:Uncharacterized protein n=1 Tax=Colletotrichum tanaceti TaxID=1306861 RepID=A0A4U6X0L1_9PEZI|nr:hypothetical protein CTA2_7969 [Colletotrichum tanaceti]TKW48880.1 hypothetical protein CTA1_1014 [Colletotrichum tanaceti]